MSELCSIALAGVVRRRRCRGSIRGVRPATRGLRYPADPPKVEEIVAVMFAAGPGPHGQRRRGLGVGVSELMRGKASPHACPGGSPAQLSALSGVGPVPAARWSGGDASRSASPSESAS